MANVTFYDDTDALCAKLTDAVKPYSVVFILCDEHTKVHCLPHIADSIPHENIITIKSGEQHKTLDTVSLMWSVLTDNLADRKALFVNLGGGVICDMGGFAASCYKRGIDFVHIPTTLLAMVDASVGGKTGIDFDGYKNQIGVFSEAKEVLICPSFLKTLEPRQIRSGLAEVVKHYLIADADAFHALEKKGNEISADKEMIEKAVQIKSTFVSADPYEKNIRKALNLGHTIGHAVESHYLGGAGPLLHGEAVAIGMAVETIISNKLGILRSDKADEILVVLKRLFELRHLPKADIDSIINLTAQDKKNAEGKRKFVLLTDIGSYQIDVEVSMEIMKEAIENYNDLI